MPATPPQTALLTGASSGIGYELAKVFAQDGINLVLVARREALLTQLKTELEQRHGIQVTALVADLAVPGQAAAVYDQCQAQGLQLDYLVNNAGYGTYGPVARETAATYDNMLTLDVLALTALTTLVVRDMVARGRGRILNIGSTSAFQPVPRMAVYGAAKAYVLNFTEALHAELRGTGVTATVLSPGVTATGFVERAAMGQAGLAQGRLLDAAVVARAGYQAMQQGRLGVIPGWRDKLLALGTRLVPSRRLMLAMSALVSRPVAAK